MADALVSTVIEQLMSFLVQELKEEVGLVVGARGEVKKLSATFKKIHAVLDDAEKQQIKDESVKLWIEELKDVAYDIDDVLDEWHTRILKSQVSGVKSAQIGKKKVCSCLLSPFNSFNKITLHHDISHRMKEIRNRLDVIASEKDKYDFKITEKETEVPEIRLGTSSVINILEVCGREQEREIIVSKLVSECSHQDNVPVVSIVGMGGLGKTTLAQLVFNDDKVKSHFEKRVWVCVSDPFDAIKLSKTIVKHLGGSFPDDIEWESLHNLLCNSIEGKLLLIVLDDAWNEDQEKWKPLKDALNRGARGSRIVVTTRSEKVARMMGSAHIQNLQLLSKDDSWSLFSSIAFAGKENERNKLEKVGREITNKCGRLPLAIKAVGSLMVFKKTSQDWYDVLHGHEWEFLGVEQGVLPALLLSYFALPSHLKRCFTYCAIFPKDMEIQKDMLIKLWMSQGFLISKGRKEPESIGAEYFDNLAMRSFFQDFEKDDEGNIIRFKIHDFLHDLAQTLTQNECLFMENNEFKGSKVRHLTAEKIRDVNSICSANNIRTLFTSEESILGLFHQLTYLRALVLYLGANSNSILPPEVEKLIHLRYLYLSGTELKQLPETITNLYNLQTLMLSDCDELCELPQGMGKLVNLRHLGIESTLNLEFLPQGIGRLSSLRTLCKFIVGGGCNIGELKNLDLLQGKLEIKRLERVTNKDEAKEAELKNKQYLRDLRLSFEWNDSSETSEVERIEGVLEGLEPHGNLIKLKIKSYIGSKFPRWMMSGTVLFNLRILSVYRCNCVQLTFLESLEKLTIKNMPKVKRIGCEFFGIDSTDGVERSVPKLETLKFGSMDNLEEWDLNMKDVMPRLKHLTVRYCPKLKRIPALGNLECIMSSSTIRFLEISECPLLTWTQSCLPPLLETLKLECDAGDLLKEIPASNSLKSLAITGAKCVSLPRGLAQLKSLTRLIILYCNKLECLPEELQHLTSLLELEIRDCFILGPRCQKGGEDWKIISHIPNIKVDYKNIHVTVQFCATGLIGLLHNALVNYDSQFDIQDAWNQTLSYNGEEGYCYRATAAASYEKILEDNWNVTYALYL
ncbi:hypothetical protein GIB67_017045 [Kingdonia uniflora]|uniref:Uncharacterized protein n=1 Tax=Kingdonia uniflora TaxID=39325 RepID=A0A7J7NCZ0_9MAGN|nr:hypothetical protein GIB67_017045 [Kingdonia uniflora]